MFKIGQDVYDIRFGWGKVILIDNTDDRCICVEYEDSDKEIYINYYADGKYDETDFNRSLFLDYIPIPDTATNKIKWRAKPGGTFFYVDMFGYIRCATDTHKEDGFVQILFQINNYFRTIGEAENSEIYKAFKKE